MMTWRGRMASHMMRRMRPSRRIRMRMMMEQNFRAMLEGPLPWPDFAGVCCDGCDEAGGERALLAIN